MKNHHSGYLTLVVFVALSTAAFGLHADIKLEPAAGEGVVITNINAAPDFEVPVCFSDGTSAETGELGKCISQLIGPKGDTGPQGPQGVKGDKGDVGATGPTKTWVILDSDGKKVGEVVSFVSLDKAIIKMIIAGRENFLMMKTHEFLLNAEIVFKTTDCTGQQFIRFTSKKWRPPSSAGEACKV